MPFLSTLGGYDDALYKLVFTLIGPDWLCVLHQPAASQVYLLRLVRHG